MTGSAPEPPATPKAAATRARLLELASTMFVAHGYAAVSLNDIAASAGLTKGAIYGHFRSKGQLLVEVIRTRLAAGDARFDPTASVDDALAQFVNPASRELRLLQIDAAAAARHDADVAAGLAELLRDRTARIEASFDGLADASTLAFVVNALSAGIGVQEAQGREPPGAETWTRVVGPMFMAALKARDESAGRDQ